MYIPHPSLFFGRFNSFETHPNQILLTQRDDFEVWILPSGGVEDGESVAQAAIRETKEETGLEVELTGLVGLYSRIGLMPDNHAVLFTAKVIGGSLKPQPGETIDVRFFPFDEIPEDLSLGHAKRIEDALRGVGGGGHTEGAYGNGAQN